MSQRRARHELFARAEIHFGDRAGIVECGRTKLDAHRLGVTITKASAIAAGRACVTRMDVFAVSPPNTPATITQPRKKILSSRRSAHSAHASPAARNPL
jgi:hypothetical protein